MKCYELLKKATHVAVTQPCVIVRVWGSSRGQCRRLFSEVRNMLPVAAAETNVTQMRIVLPNQSEIRFANSAEADRYRGEATVLEVVTLPEFVREVAAPCLFDKGGELLVESYE